MSSEIITPSGQVCRFIAITNLEADDSFQALSRLAAILSYRKFTRASFLPALLEREREFPTGVQLEGPYNIALAHTEPEHVLINSIILGILKQQVNFHNMSDPESTIPVKLVFLIAATNTSAISFFIEKLVAEVFLKPEVVTNLAALDDKNKIEIYFHKKVFAS